ncbi:hypothetical protein DSM104299_03622 [Baekduia alba]|uniref:homocysteine S-methyltransferase family protein n=1 Tax=Baekduia alba TaxID=2997333 RepID=UPI00234199A4|nr:homocysteine S-methyltransferase family protein [Baekduia alba]WCB94882.1 hypothetical protein DSM104299_03622 [Baekduia alba]
MTVDAVGGYRQIDDALTAGRCVLLDGGVGTELLQEQGQDDERLWGFESLASAPDDVLDVHRRYVDAGVDVITTNTWALPTALQNGGSVRRANGRPIHWMEIARRGVRVARQAIADGGRDGRCAVALAVNGDLDTPEGIDVVSVLARALIDDPPDIILFETLSVLRPSLFAVVEALQATGIPTWVSFRRCPHGLCGVYGQHWGGPEADAFGHAARRFEGMGVGALLVNCIPPDHVDGIVSYLRDFTDMPLGVYPNLGYYTSAGWRFESEIGGPQYAAMALRWRAEGAQIIGGCCGTRAEHIAAAGKALDGIPAGRERRFEREGGEQHTTPSPARQPDWTDKRGRTLYPLTLPEIDRHTGVARPIPGSHLLWRHLFLEGVGAHQRCLDIACGAGLQTIQLALNGAAHVHALDVDTLAVGNTLANAFRNGVADRVSGEAADLFPWLPEEHYEVIVASLPQTPVGPAAGLASHRPTDYWGRGLVDQVIAKLPHALAKEGIALLTHTSLLSRERTMQLLAERGLYAEVVAWQLEPLPTEYLDQGEHLAQLEQHGEGYLVHTGESRSLVVYVLEIRHGRTGANGSPPWASR